MRNLLIEDKHGRLVFLTTEGGKAVALIDVIENGDDGDDMERVLVCCLIFLGMIFISVNLKPFFLDYIHTTFRLTFSAPFKIKFIPL